MVKLLDLPTDLILLIFSEFERAPLTQRDGLYIASFQPKWEGLPTLQACRLTCRSLNELVSGMLCPLLRGHLDKKTMERITHLSKNPLIAQGVRTLGLNLAFRPKPLAMDLRQYCDFVTDKVDRLSGSCSYHTEFGNYQDEDQSADAIRHRSLLAASHQLYLIRESWRQCVNPESTPYKAADASYQQLLKDCFAAYGLKRREEEEIIHGGSFVSVIASAVSRFTHLDFLRFVDRRDERSPDPVLVANDRYTLTEEMLMPHDWLAAENLNAEAELLPARILFELPVACQRLQTPLEGLDIGCFPLKRSFSSLLPPGSVAVLKSLESDLASAFQSLKFFQFGRNGMNSTPYREERIHPDDCAIIDAYLKAACSSRALIFFHCSMTPLRVCNQRGRGPEAADLFYQAGAILRTLNSSHLTHVEILDVEVSNSDLELVIGRLPRYTMKKIRLCAVELTEGVFATSIDLLRSIKDDAKDCSIDLTTLQGGELGPPRGFNNDGIWFAEDEDAEEFWNSLEDHMNPPLLQQAKAYINGETHANPLLG